MYVRYDLKIIENLYPSLFNEPDTLVVVSEIRKKYAKESHKIKKHYNSDDPVLIMY